MKIQTITAAQIVGMNRKVCIDGGNRHQCYDIGKIESALHSAFYPGSAPFEHGGVATIAGAMCYYLIKAHAFFDGNKRTAFIAGTVFMELNGLDLVYPSNVVGTTEASGVIDRVASGEVSKEQLMDWFDLHKKPVLL